MKKMAMLGWSLVTCLSAGLAQASAIDDLRAFATHTQSARGAFTQRVTGSSGKAQKPAQGSFAFQRPGKFSWVFKKPYEQSLIADGQNLYVYDKDLNQVTVKPLAGAIGASPAEILFGGNDLAKNFDLKTLPSRDGVDWLRATPKRQDTPFQQIDIGFKQGVLAAMSLQDTFGQTTLLSFAEVEKNPALAADVFRFTPPAGADVLRTP